MIILIAEKNSEFAKKIERILSVNGHSIEVLSTHNDVVRYLKGKSSCSSENRELFIISSAFFNGEISELILNINNRNVVIPFTVVLINKGEEYRLNEFIQLGVEKCLIRDDKLFDVLPDIVKKTEVEIEKDKKIKEVEAELNIKNEKLLLLATESKKGIWDFNLRDHSFFLSQDWAEHLGYKSDEMPQDRESFEKLIHPEDLLEVKSTISNYSTGKINKSEVSFRCRHRSGQYIWILSKGEAVKDEKGEIYRIIGSHTDITEMKKSEIVLNNFFEQPQSLNLIADLDGYIKRINIGWEIHLGYKKSEIEGKRFFDFIHPEDQESTELEVSKLNKGISTFYFENRYRHKNGDYKFLVWSATGFPEENIVYAVAYDVTDRKKAESNLRKEHSRLNNIIQATNIGTWEWNVQSGETVFNHQWAEMLGYRLEELSPVTIKTWEDLTHPDDLKRASQLLQKHFEGKLAYYECELRMKHKRGDWMWIRDHGKLISWTPEGKPLMMFGTHIDISKRKNAEDRIRESEQKFRNYVQNSPIGIFIADERGNYVEINKAAEQITGYSKRELLSMNLVNLVPKAERQKALKHFETLLKEGKSKGETKFIKKDGSENNWIVDAIKISETRFLGFVTDISELKRAENLLKESEVRYKSLFDEAPFMIWEEDFSETKLILEELKRRGVADFDKYFDENNDELIKCLNSMKVLSVNKTVLSFFGANSKDDLLWNLRKTFTNDAMEVFKKALISLVEENSFFEAETTQKKLNGEERDIFMRIFIPDNNLRKFSRVIVVMMDITDRKRLERGLIAEEKRGERQRAAFNEIVVDGSIYSFDLREAMLKIAEVVSRTIEVERVGIWILSEDKKELECNTLFNLNENKHIKEVSLKLTDYPNYIKAILQENTLNIKNALSDPRTEELVDNYLLQHRIKSMLDASIRIGDRFIGVICLEHIESERSWEIDEESFLRTISSLISQIIVNTERRKTEIQVKEYAKELEISNNSKDRFLSILSHDLRSPFQGLLGVSEVLAEDSATLEKEEIMEYAAVLHKAISNQYHLLNDLLNWIKLQNRNFILNPVVIKLRSAIESAYEPLMINVSQKNLELINSIAPDCIIYADEKMMEMVFRNLISNAIKFSYIGGKIEISANDFNSYTEIYFKDYGVGISSDIVPNLFSDIRYTTEGTNNEQGSGLGLTLCNEIVRKHFGEIRVESEEGKGSIFTISLHKIVESDISIKAINENGDSSF